MAKQVEAIIKLQIKAGAANPSPPWLCRCRASHSLILSLSHQVKTNTRFARACFPADVPNYAIFSSYSLIHIQHLCQDLQQDRLMLSLDLHI